MARLSSSQSTLFNLPERPDFSGETRLRKQGLKFVAGVDEVGRGPLAGPVVAAAIILDSARLPEGLDDSKRLTAARREQLYDLILESALAVSIAGLSAESIDRSDIRKASLEAMRRAVCSLAVKPDHVLVDGRDMPPGLPCGCDAWIKGDQRSLSIAAASIVAKVMRDRMMERAGRYYPGYGMEKHAGYATLAHRNAIIRQGPVPALHRFSFAPIRSKEEGGS